MNAFSKNLTIVLVVVLTGMLLFAGCANTADSCGKALGNLGNAVQEVGEGAGTVLTGFGEDVQDASRTQLNNSQ